MPTLADAVTLTLAGGYIGGKTYVVYIRGTDATTGTVPNPILPSSITSNDGSNDRHPDASANSQLVRTIFSGAGGNSNIAMPNLEEFFNVGGGTIDLVVDGAAKWDVVINEIMWAVDDSKIGQDGYTNQQWIEVYNRKTTPVPAPSFVFTDDTFPASSVTTTNAVDRISNIQGHQNIWKPPIKGSSGTATRTGDDSDAAGIDDSITGANPAFASIYRNKQAADGFNAGHWTASTRPYYPGFNGTPGAENKRGGLPTTRDNPEAYTPPKNRVIINEVFLSGTAGFDWLELRNVSDKEQNIKDWHVTWARATLQETSVHKFAGDIKIPAGEVLLIVAKGPDETNLAAGDNIDVTRANEDFGAGPHKYKVISDFALPEVTDGFLMLRSHGDTKFLTGRKNLHDAVGYFRESHNTLAAVAEIKEKETGFYWKTDAWPINGHSGADNGSYRKHDKPGSSNTNASLNPAHKLGKGHVWARTGTNHGWRKDGGVRAGYQGGIGYDRNVAGNGTPGYHNDIAKGKVADLGANRGLYISELMLTTDGGRYPQWIELYNNSDVSIDLAADGSDADGSGKGDGWRMIVENYNSGDWKSQNRPIYVVVKLKDLFAGSHTIPPRQTMLIVSNKGRNSEAKYFPNHRVASIWEKAKGTFKMADRRDTFLNAEGGFYIKIVDGAGNVADEIGNLDGKQASVRGGVPIDEPVGFMWPTNMAADGNRTSLVRLVDDATQGISGSSRGIPGTPRIAVPTRDDTGAATDSKGSVLPLGVLEPDYAGDRDGKGKGNVWLGAGRVGEDGEKMLTWAEYADAAWVHASDTKMAFTQDTWYGVNTDHGTPGHIAGTPLPVELSFFRPTLENGKVTIQWTTESELDNAGFNILRSEARDGEFTQVNEQMIQGKGTTAERSTYKWVDTTAKPGAVYYYQIEDVSFAGEHNTLATTKLKGLISAKGKLTTSWGDIKNASQ